MSKKWKYTEVRQVGGDDGYQWALFRKGDPRYYVNGCTRREIDSYRRNLENHLHAIAHLEACIRESHDPDERKDFRHEIEVLREHGWRSGAGAIAPFIA